MIQFPKQQNLHPDVTVGVQITADMLTGDGIFANTSLMRLPVDGWLILNVTGDNNAHELYVPQECHKEGIAQPVPVLGAGIMPYELKTMNYKIKCPAHSSPAVMIDLNTGSAAYALGMFYSGHDNPVALNTPDIVVKYAHANAQDTITNLLDGTDLEDVPYSGWLYTMVWSNQIDTQVIIRQRNYRTGNYSQAPSNGAGTYGDLSNMSLYKEWIPKNGQPTVTVTAVTSAVWWAECGFFIRN